jgi:hypothetical protein
VLRRSFGSAPRNDLDDVFSVSHSVRIRRVPVIRGEILQTDRMRACTPLFVASDSYHKWPV